MPATLGELATRFGLELRGDPDRVVTGVAALGEAGPRDVSFLANPKFRRYLPQTSAGVVILDRAAADSCPVPALVTSNPYAAYARIATWLYPPAAAPAPGIHASAVVEKGARLDAGVAIGPQAYVSSGAVIGPRVVVGPGSVLDGNIEIGAATRLSARVTLIAQVTLGARCLLHPGVVLGADGFGLAPDRDGWVKVPQLGGVRVGDDVEIGANTTIDRGAIGDTVIEDGVKLDNQIQIGHNVRIGAHTAIAACVGVAGSTTIGKRCMIGGGAGFAGHLEIADDVVINGYAMVTRSLTKKGGQYASGLPVDEVHDWRHTVGRVKRLERLNQRVRRLEQAAGSEPPDNADDPRD
jgi:UDP-3-O-[3-hydroxymyristoyl] glucosamine N-acyltransferase